MSVVAATYQTHADPLSARPPAVPGTVDDLERFLARLEWTLLDFRRAELAASRTIIIAGNGVRFHYVVSGTVEVTGAGEPIVLAGGDFLLLPRVGTYQVRACGAAVIASGGLGLVSTAAHPLIAALPEVLVACGLFLREPHIASLADGLSREFGEVRPGMAVMGSRIATIIASAAVRAWVENGCAPDQWLVSVQDPYIARAIAAMHSNPGERWTVASLAGIARTSRSVFAERFRMLVGDSPARYLASLRMERGKELLSRDHVSVAEAALRLGYGSEAAFSRAFRRHSGASPAAWRRQSAAQLALQPAS
ncbi:AraC family transcriptional regulator [Rathayibacter soli]|uniref:AraC family transcriptional regulator n=1 Tax=Rathayibacter soli TaxID=3144168 RepID=UPI0027E3D266|nr:AraC family transcriptional regulator [Glaciibacter superstes]